MWLAPAALVAAVVGGLAYLRHRTLTPAPGDVVTVPATTLLGGATVPGIPADAQVAVQLEPVQTAADRWQAQVIGHVDPRTGEIVPLAVRLSVAVQFPRTAVTGLYRGTPLRRVS